MASATASKVKNKGKRTTRECPVREESLKIVPNSPFQSFGLEFRNSAPETQQVSRVKAEF